MTFDEWIETKLPLAHIGKKELARQAWEAALEDAAVWFAGKWFCTFDGNGNPNDDDASDELHRMAAEAARGRK